jgi:hypothetical protein
MGATLAWLKVVDTGRWRLEGGALDLKPGMDNVVELTGPAPADAAPFVVHRAWSNFDTAFTERWYIRDPYGRTIRDPVEREVLAADASPTTSRGIVDEVLDQLFEFTDTGYQLVIEVDEREVARADFEVRELTETEPYAEGG